MTILGKQRRTSAANRFPNNFNVVDKVRPKKMNFFKKWLYRAVNEVHESENTNQHLFNEVELSRDQSIDQPDKRITFHVYSTSGGRVVETSRYDTKRDESYRNLYIIHHDDDFGKEIDKIITCEYMRK